MSLNLNIAPDQNPQFSQNFMQSMVQSGNGGSGARGGDVGSHNTATTNVYIMSQETENKAIDLLLQNSASGAFHNSAERYDAPKCHPRTREAIIKEIMHWMETDTKGHPFLWMYGPAGTGKSSIAQTIANLLHQQGRIAGSFFFSRTAANRNTSDRLITSIAYQLTIAIPNIRKLLASAIERDHAIFSRSLEAQLDSLIVGPLSTLSQDGSLEDWHSGLIIIDGLDECGDSESQRHVLSVLFSVFEKSAYLPLFFLIASRPEHQIRTFFNRKEVSFRSRRIVLDDRYKPDDDIAIFLRSCFSEIRRDHPAGAALPSSWPSESDLKRLVKKASGQFIYVSTVMKFVESASHWPPDMLEIAFGLVPSESNTPFSQLDALYSHVFSSVKDIQRVHEILAFLLLRGGRQAEARPNLIEDFFSLRRGEMQVVLKDLHSVLDVPPPKDRSKYLRFFHASLTDFLLDRTRSGQFFIDSELGYSWLTRYSVKHIVANPSVDGFPSSRDLPRGDQGAFHFLLMCYCGFLDYCRRSRATNALLEDLAALDLTAYLNCAFKLFHADDIREFVLSFLPPLFQWLQTKANNELYSQYLEKFDAFLRQKLADYSDNPSIFYLYAACTLEAFYGDLHRHDFVILMGSAPGGPFPGGLSRKQIQDLLRADKRSCRIFDSRKALHNYHGSVSDFLLDERRSGIYHVSHARLAEVVKHCVRFLNDPWTSEINSPDLLCCDLLLALLPVVEKDTELAQYLIDNPIQRDLEMVPADERENVLLAIQSYIKGSRNAPLRHGTPERQAPESFSKHYLHAQPKFFHKQRPQETGRRVP